MDNTTIERLMTENTLTREHFGGVYPSDLLPDIPIHGKNHYIVNLDPSGEPGSHWVALIVNRAATSEYFDSYGLPPPHNLSFRRIMSERYNFNTVQLQHVLTAVCGQYCMHFLHQRARGFSMKEIVQDFTDDYLVNDIAVNSAVEETFNANLDVVDEQIVKETVQRARACG